MLRRLPSLAEMFAAALVSASVVAAAVGLRGRESADMPNPKLTPGETLPHITLAMIQEPGFQKTTRDVDQAKRNEVARRYGLPLSALRHCEVDHSIPASWGGSSNVENLWPQSYRGQWNARVKDRLEVRGLAMIRKGELDLHDAQREIADDWKAMYRRLISKSPQEYSSAEEEQ